MTPLYKYDTSCDFGHFIREALATFKWNIYLKHTVHWKIVLHYTYNFKTKNMGVN
jgi:hypothetical protein